MKRVFVLGITLAAGVAWSQTPAPTPPPTTAPVPNPAIFTGPVTGWTTTDIRVSRYSFGPGGRTVWHSHERGQTITVEEGTLRTQNENGPLRHFHPLDTFFTPPGVKHWHGATPTEAMRQVSTSFGVTTYLSPVSDADYAGTAAATPPAK